jgi:uncharacterized protein YecT (DUF1311 family)
MRIFLPALVGLTTLGYSSMGLAQAQSPTPSARELAAFKRCVASSDDAVAQRACDQPLYDSCEARNERPGTTISMTECTMTTNSAWDTVLNERYRSVMASAGPALKTKIQAAQRAWIVSRDADCKAVYEANIGGTIRGPAFAACMATKTADRAMWLEELGQ